MRLIIAGSRHFDAAQISELIKKLYSENKFDLQKYTLIISGGANGVDHAGEIVAVELNLSLAIVEADWDQFGNAAGPIRNRDMAKMADALLLVWDGRSKGSKNMKKEMERLNKPVFEIVLGN